MAAELCEELTDWCRSNPALTPYLGTGIDCRVYTDTAKQAAKLPFVVFTEVGVESVESLSGPAGLVHVELHVWSFGETRAQANKVDRAFRDAVTPFNDVMGTLKITEFTSLTHRNFGADLPQDGSDQKRYWVQRSYNVWHEETT